jgi:hypothetical protein
MRRTESCGQATALTAEPPHSGAHPPLAARTTAWRSSTLVLPSMRAVAQLRGEGGAQQ